MDDIYREEILEHYRHPYNYGRISDADIDKEDSNPLCGDIQRIRIKLDGKGRISAISFSGKGCAISIATASILTEHLKGKSLSDAQGMTREELLDLIGLNLTPTRIKCAMLPLTTIKKGIIEYETRNNAKQRISSAISEVKKRNKAIIKKKKIISSKNKKQNKIPNNKTKQKIITRNKKSKAKHGKRKK